MFRNLLTRRQGDRLDRQPPAVAESEALRARFVSLRVRLLGLVMLILVPWLALVLYTQANERDVEIASVHRDATRVLDIVTINQAAQIEAAQQLLAALGPDVEPHRVRQRILPSADGG